MAEMLAECQKSAMLLPLLLPRMNFLYAAGK